ncbi:MAG: acetolactate synthase small subunit [Verrucomicrobia bacterium]|nr:acetolactate synthase small subunit [Verrucomicrobiota bacterium]
MTSLTDIQTHTLSIYVANKPGALARIAQVFARRGYNIDSLVVSPSADGRYSRMTITAQGSAEGLEQIILQAGKLVDVLHCTDHSNDQSVVREMALVKIGVVAEDRAEVLQVLEHFGAKTVDLSESSMIAMITGASDKVDASIQMLRKFNIIELVRTGKVLMSRGDQVT